MAETSIRAEVRGRMGLITLNRPAALNALSLEMIRGLTGALPMTWREQLQLVAVRYSNSQK